MKRYSDREVRSILHSAIQAHEKERNALEEGMSLLEIEAVAKDLGIPPEIIRKAARQTETRSRARFQTIFFGEPLALDHEESVVPGLTSEESDRLKLAAVGLVVDVTDTDNGSNVRVVDRLSAPAGGLFGGLIGGLGLGAGLGVGLGVGVGVLGSPLFCAIVPCAFLAFSYALARVIYRRIARGRRRRLAELIQRHLGQRKTRHSPPGQGLL